MSFTECSECEHYGHKNGRNPDFYGGCRYCVHNQSYSDCFTKKVK